MHNDTKMTAQEIAAALFPSSMSCAYNDDYIVDEQGNGHVALTVESKDNFATYKWYAARIPASMPHHFHYAEAITRCFNATWASGIDPEAIAAFIDEGEALLRVMSVGGNETHDSPRLAAFRAALAAARITPKTESNV